MSDKYSAGLRPGGPLVKCFFRDKGTLQAEGLLEARGSAQLFGARWMAEWAMEEALLWGIKLVFSRPADLSISGWESAEKTPAFLKEAAKRDGASGESLSAFLRSAGCG